MKLAASVPCSMSQAGHSEQGASQPGACLQAQRTQTEVGCCCALQPGAMPRRVQPAVHYLGTTVMDSTHAQTPEEVKPD